MFYSCYYYYNYRYGILGTEEGEFYANDNNYNYNTNSEIINTNIYQEPIYYHHQHHQQHNDSLTKAIKNSYYRELEGEASATAATVNQYINDAEEKTNEEGIR